MTSKERVLAAINHQTPDRIPIQTYLTPEIQQKLMDHFGFTDPMRLHEKFGVDFRSVQPVFIGQLPPLPEGSQHVDEWGVGYMIFDHGHGGAYPEANHLALAKLDTMEEVENYPWPSPDDYDYSRIEAQCDALADYAVCTGHAGMPDIVNGVSRGRGMERVMMDIMTQDPVGVAIIDRRCDFYYEIAKRTLEAAKGKIDILCLGEDTGNQNGPMFPPAIFDSFFRPRIERYIRLAHEYGAKAMMHSCGNTRRLQAAFIDMGLDVLDAMQPEPEGMVPEEIRAESGERLTLCGLISTQQTLPFGTVEDCRAEARHRLELFAEGGGYIFSPAHCIQADNPVENVLAIYEEALGLEPGAFS
jgi:uroporphyrinogen decarboxylase